MSRKDQVTRFFTQELPFMTVQNINELFAHEGALSFDVAGQHWSFVFSSEEPVVNELLDEAELKLTFTAPAFLEFVDGTLDIVDAVKSKRVTAAGTAFELLERFGRILRPPAQSLGWEAE